jgi:BirA family transcriptional regulator, biotin operon repressor / biotin---[acetyl-CoA-carboxylase] ligase
VAADSVAAEAVVPLLRGRFGRPYTFLERCESTQRELPADAPEGAVFVADEQTRGRGRLGRSWFAPAGTSILLSLNLRPAVETPRLPELPVVAGEACADAIAAVCGLRPGIELPNDLLVDGRKLGGILAEAREGRVVLGIGINVNVAADELPAGVDTPATSLLVELRRRVDRAPLVAELLVQLERRYDAWAASAA